MDNYTSHEYRYGLNEMKKKKKKDLKKKQMINCHNPKQDPPPKGLASETDLLP